jgi:hypothetical protein
MARPIAATVLKQIARVAFMSPFLHRSAYDNREDTVDISAKFVDFLASDIATGGSPCASGA